MYIYNFGISFSGLQEITTRVRNRSHKRTYVRKIFNKNTHKFALINTHKFTKWFLKITKTLLNQMSQMVQTHNPSSPNRLCKCVLCSGFFKEEIAWST